MFLHLLGVFFLGIVSVSSANTRIVLQNQRPNSTVYVERVGAVSLVCTVHVTSAETTELYWVKDGQRICTLEVPLNNFRGRCDRPKNKHSLFLSVEDKTNIRNGEEFNMTFKINNFVFNDIGAYWCSKEDQTSALTGPLNLNILRTPQSDYPECSSSSDLESLQEGKSLQLSCVLRGGAPRPLLAWFRITQDGKSERLSRYIGLPFNNLTINHVMSPNDNQAIYACMASHPTFKQPDKRNCSLGPVNVVYSPKVMIAVVYTYEDNMSQNNSSVNLITCICRADSNPPPTKFSWSVENIEFASISTETENASVLHIRMPKLFISGVYTEARKPTVKCEATNTIDIGSGTVVLNFSDVTTAAPMLEVESEHTTSLFLVGPITGAFFAGVIVTLIISTLVYVKRLRRMSFGLHPPKSIVYSGDSNTANVVPYHIGYIRDGGREMVDTRVTEMPGTSQPVYEDVNQEQASTDPMLTAADDSRYTPLVPGEHPDSYEKLRVQPDNANVYEYSDILNYAEPDQFVPNRKQ